MNKDIEDKLNWLMDQGVDPKRSQIHSSVIYSPLHNNNVAFDLFDFHRNETIYYDELASWIYQLDDKRWEKDKTRLIDLVNAIYDDANKNDMWGIEYDW